MLIRPSIALLLGAAALLSAMASAQTAPHSKSSGQVRTKDPAMSAADTQRLQVALTDYDSGNLQRARPVLVELATRYPQQPQVQAAAGMTLAELGDVAGALPLLRRAHQLAPRDAAIGLNLAVALLKTGHAADAVALLRTGVQRQPHDTAMRVALAQAEMQSGQPGPAAASYAQADGMLRAGGQPVNADLRQDWSAALLAAGRAAEAATVLEGIPGVEGSAPAQALLAEAEEKSGHYEAAVGHFKRAAELDPSEVNLYAYGNELMQHWTFPAAVEVLTYAVGRYPASERLWLAQGVAWYGDGKYEKAVPVFAQVLASDPDSATAADLLGRSCSALSGGQQPGCATLRQFAEAHPGNAPASLYAAVSILHRSAEEQDGGAAEKLLRNALRVDPKLAEAWYQLAVLQQSRNEWQGSADSLDRALALRPGYAEAHYRLSRAYAHLGRRDEAQQQIALQQKYAEDAKAAESKRRQEVTTFLTTSN